LNISTEVFRGKFDHEIGILFNVLEDEFLLVLSLFFNNNTGIKICQP